MGKWVRMGCERVRVSCGKIRVRFRGVRVSCGKVRVSQVDCEKWGFVVLWLPKDSLRFVALVER